MKKQFCPVFSFFSIFSVYTPMRRPRFSPLLRRGETLIDSAIFLLFMRLFSGRRVPCGSSFPIHALPGAKKEIRAEARPLPCQAGHCRSEIIHYFADYQLTFMIHAWYNQI